MTQKADSPDKKIPTGFRVVEISREPVELYKILKFEGLAGSGGDAKAAVASGQVVLNGSIETQKRKKIVAGDTIEFGNDKIFIRLDSATTKSVDQPIAKRAPAKARPLANRKSIPAIASSTGKKPRK